jgi:hypothetical protein
LRQYPLWSGLSALLSCQWNAFGSSPNITLGGALGFKAPTLAELFQNFPSFNFFANPNLKPETSIGFDLGFDNAGFLAAARTLACERGPAAVTIDSVTQRLRAPMGSFYYRFASRDALLGELWLATVLAYQEGFVAAIEAGDGLAAALHTPAWARQHLDDACLLLLYSATISCRAIGPHHSNAGYAIKPAASRHA